MSDEDGTPPPDFFAEHIESRRREIARREAMESEIGALFAEFRTMLDHPFARRMMDFGEEQVTAVREAILGGARTSAALEQADRTELKYKALADASLFTEVLNHAISRARSRYARAGRLEALSMAAASGNRDDLAGSSLQEQFQRAGAGSTGDD